jgi:hypothetical protein
MSQIVTPHDDQKHSPPARHIACMAVALVVGLLVMVEEARYGQILGKSDLFCDSIGGKRDTVTNRCFTVLCYWFDECGRPAHPGYWRRRVASGDSIAKVVFWVGKPYTTDGDAYYWGSGKGSVVDTYFSATFRNGKFVEWHDDVEPPPKLKTN